MENFKLLIAEQRLSNTGAALTGFQKEIFDSPYVSCGSHKGTTSDDDMNLKPNSLPGERPSFLTLACLISLELTQPNKVYPFVLELKQAKSPHLPWYLRPPFITSLFESCIKCHITKCTL